jgi:putative ABC transport system permease protein
MNTVRQYFRSVLDNRLFSVITIGSFTVSIAVIIILSSFLVSEFSYDAHIADIDRIYRVRASHKEAAIPELARQQVLEKLPEIEAATCYISSEESFVYNNHDFNVRTVHTDDGFFSVLPVKVISGNSVGIFNDKNNILISESFAREVFGSLNPIGQTVTLSHQAKATVAGIFADLPGRSTLPAKMLCSIKLRLRYGMDCYNNNCVYFYKLLLKLKPGVAMTAVSSKLDGVVSKTSDNDNNSYSLLPYKNAYFDLSLGWDDLQHCNIKLLKLLSLLTVILLLMSVFNYVNLSVAHNTGRIKEFGVKQALGAGSVRLFLQFLAEALLTIVIATTAGALLAVIIKPLFVSLLGKEFALAELVSKPMLMILCISSLFLISLACAIYPALLATKIRARDLMQKKIPGREVFDIRKILNIAQFAATTVLIISLIVLTRQIKYVKTMDLGFSTEQLINIPIHWQAKEKAASLKNEFRSIAGVKEVCYSFGNPGNIYSYNEYDNTGKVSSICSDYSFVRTFELKIIDGRNFFEGEKDTVCLLNKSALKQLGWDNINGKKIFGQKVVGVVDDFHYQDMYTRIGALCISNTDDISCFNLRLNPGNTRQILEDIRKAYLKVLPDFEFTFSFYNEMLGLMYSQEEKRAASIRIIALIAVFISCIGLFGLVEFSTRKRIKEIGIRKVNGARSFEVLAMLNGDFLKWLLISIVLATPVAWYIMNSWLQTFAYKTSLSWWIFPAAGLIVLILALLTVSWQSWKASSRNPVEALRYE